MKKKIGNILNFSFLSFPVYSVQCLVRWSQDVPLPGRQKAPTEINFEDVK